MHPTYHDVKRIFGDIDDRVIAEMLIMDATLPELQEAAAYLAQETNVMAEHECPLAGRALRVHELVRSLDDEWEDAEEA